MKIGDKEFIENALNVYEFDKTNIAPNSNKEKTDVKEK